MICYKIRKPIEFSSRGVQSPSILAAATTDRNPRWAFAASSAVQGTIGAGLGAGRR